VKKVLSTLAYAISTGDQPAPCSVALHHNILGAGCYEAHGRDRNLIREYRP